MSDTELQRKNLTIFYLPDCPYCVKARRAVDELKAEFPKYEAIQVNWLNERSVPDIAEQFDYYYVPTVASNSSILYEAQPGQTYNEIKAHLKNIFENELSS